jgi:hypothetical protein
MSSITVVADELVSAIVLYKPRHWLMRWDTLPFILIYGACLMCSSFSSDVYYKNTTMILMPIFLALHLYLFVASQASVNVRCWIGNTSARSHVDASLVHVSAAKNAGTDRLLSLDRANPFARIENNEVAIMNKKYRITHETFQFQKVNYEFDETTHKFSKLEYPVRGYVTDYLRWLGHENAAIIDKCLAKWGYNEFDIPLVNFLDLYLVIDFSHHAISRIPFLIIRFSFRITWLLHSLYFNAFACSCGRWMIIGTTVPLRCSCSCFSKA